MLRSVTLSGSFALAALVAAFLPAAAHAQTLKTSKIGGVRATSLQYATGKLLKVHVYLDGTWPGKGGMWVPDAEVTISRPNSQFRRTLRTDEYSDASFFVPPGTYEIHVRKAGVGEGKETHVVPEAGLFVSFPLSKASALANFPKDKLVLYPRPRLPLPR